MRDEKACTGAPLNSRVVLSYVAVCRTCERVICGALALQAHVVCDSCDCEIRLLDEPKGETHACVPANVCTVSAAMKWREDRMRLLTTMRQPGARIVGDETHDEVI